MTKDEILEQLTQNAVCVIGDRRAIANKSRTGTYRIDYKHKGEWKTWENDLEREDAAELLHVQLQTKKRPA